MKIYSFDSFHCDCSGWSLRAIRSTIRIKLKFLGCWKQKTPKDMEISLMEKQFNYIYYWNDIVIMKSMRESTLFHFSCFDKINQHKNNWHDSLCCIFHICNIATVARINWRKYLNRMNYEQMWARYLFIDQKSRIKCIIRQLMMLIAVMSGRHEPVLWI